jgi:hypothetical protein
MDEGTCICIIAGFICLSFVVNNMAKHQTQNPQAMPPQVLVAPQPAQVDPPVDTEKQREILGARLEALHREEWCRNFEEEEIKKYQQQKWLQYNLEKRQMMLQEAQDYLTNLRCRRMELQRQMFLEEQYERAADWEMEGPEGPQVEYLDDEDPYIEYLEDGSSIEYPGNY